MNDSAETKLAASDKNAWRSGDRPWMRKAKKSQCYFCGANSVIVSWGDEPDDRGRVEVYCDNPDCDIREAEIIDMGGRHRADVRALNMIDTAPAVRGKLLLSGDEFLKMHDGAVGRRQSHDPLDQVFNAGAS